MIPPDLSIEYSFVKLPYDCAVTGIILFFIPHLQLINF